MGKLILTDAGAAWAGRWAIGCACISDCAGTGLWLRESVGHGANGEDSEDGEELHFESLVGRCFDG